MGTMSYGYHYDRGVRAGFDISFNGFTLHCVSSKDKARIIREIKASGYRRDEIDVTKVSVN